MSRGQSLSETFYVWRPQDETNITICPANYKENVISFHHLFTSVKTFIAAFSDQNCMFSLSSSGVIKSLLSNNHQEFSLRWRSNYFTSTLSSVPKKHALQKTRSISVLAWPNSHLFRDQDQADSELTLVTKFVLFWFLLWFFRCLAAAIPDCALPMLFLTSFGIFENNEAETKI